MKLDIGSGGTKYETGTWTTVDRYTDADICAEMWALPFADDSVEEIWSSHALEHVARARVIPTLGEWYRVLMPRGRCFIQVPDLDFVARYWLHGANRIWAYEYIFGAQTDDGQFHRTGWNLESFRADVQVVGFEVLDLSVLWTEQYTQESIRAELTKG